MKTVLVKSLILTGGGKSYDISKLGLVYSVGAVPTCNVNVVDGYNLTTKTNVEFSGTDDSTVYTVTVSTSDGTTDVFKGYIQSVAKNQVSNPMGGSAVATSISLLGVQSKLMKYGGANFYYFPPNNKGVPEMASDSGCLGVYSSVNNTASKDLLVVSPRQSVKQCMIGKLAQCYGVCIGQGGSSDKDVYKDLDAIISDPYNIQLRNFESTSRSAMEFPVALEKMAEGRFGGDNMLNLLFGIMSPGAFLLHLAPRLETMEMLPSLPWLKKPNITLDQGGVIGMNITSVLKGIRKRPDRIGVMIPGGGQSSPGGEPTTRYATYPQTQTASTIAEGGAVQMVAAPPWLIDIDGIRVAYDTKASKEGLATSRIKKQTDKDPVPGDYVTTGEQLAKAYFGATRNAEYMVSVSIPWYQLSFLQSTGYVIKVSNLETVPEGGVGTFYGMLSAVSLSMTSSPMNASCSMQLMISHLRDEKQNEQYGLGEHPIYISKETGTAENNAGVVAGGSSASASGVGPENNKSNLIDTTTPLDERSGYIPTTTIGSSRGSEPINDQGGQGAIGRSEFKSTYNPKPY